MRYADPDLGDVQNLMATSLSQKIWSISGETFYEDRSISSEFLLTDRQMLVKYIPFLVEIKTKIAVRHLTSRHVTMSDSDVNDKSCKKCMR